MSGKPTPNRGTSEGQRQADQQACLPGLVAGAVLRSARRSVGLSQADLADLADVSEDTVSSWEDGTSALAEAPIHQIERLERGLLAAGADPSLVADLALGAWCDVVNQSAADGEDTSCLVADPLAQEEAFSELLAWAITGQPPERHRLFRRTGQVAPGQPPSPPVQSSASLQRKPHPPHPDTPT